MQTETDSYDEFEDAIFENEEEIPSDDNKAGVKAREPKPAKNNNLATWRKIEDYWDNYRLNKQINDDPYRENYAGYLLDGELN